LLIAAAASLGRNGVARRMEGRVIGPLRATAVI
jgi:hypothetical protein